MTQRQQYVGQVNQAVFSTDDGSKHVFVLTSLNVLAGISIKTGDLVWRQVQEVPEGSKFNQWLSYNADRTSIVTCGGNFVRSWDPSTGINIWEYSLPEESYGAIQDVHFTLDNRMVLLALESLTMINGKGVVLWTRKVDAGLLNSNFRKLVPHSSGETLSIVDGFDFDKIATVTVSLSDGNVVSTDSLLAPWFEHRKCAVKASSIVCLGTGSSVHIVDIANFGAENSVMLDAAASDDLQFIALENSKAFFGVRNDVGVTIYELTGTGDAKKVVDVVGKTNELEYVESKTGRYLVVSKMQYEFVWYNLDTVSEVTGCRSDVHLSREKALPSKLFPLVVPRQSGYEVTCKLLVSLRDDTVLMIREPGTVSWTRQEALASVLSVELLDLPLSETQRNIEEEFDNTGNVIASFLRRVCSQALLVKQVLFQMTNDVISVTMGVLEDLKKGESPQLVFNRRMSGRKETGRFERDYFNLHKMIVIATAPGKLYGLDNVRGDVLWQIYVDNLQPIVSLGQRPRMPLYVLRTTAHHPHPALCAVVGKRADGESVVVSFDPMTGKESDKMVFSFTATQLLQLPVADDSGMHGLLALSDEAQVYSIPENLPQLLPSDRWINLFAFVSDDQTGKFTGYQISPTDSGYKATEVWRNSLEILNSQQKLTHVQMKSPSETVHSQGRVLGDRSVLYKYVNPNLVVVVTEGSEGSTKPPHITLHLMDAVTGSIIFSDEHKRCSGPVHVVHSENWIVYSYYNEKARRTELAVLELYEGSKQNDPIKFSSLNPPPPPVVIRQAYYFPQGLSAMGVTITERGLTSKHILIAMPFGGVLQIPKMILDPRRTFMPTMEQREEGLIPYIPELPIATEHIINYNQSLFNVRGIHSSHSGLESTTLVFIYGIDLYYTRLNPSGTFDVLKDDFDHWLISAVLIALVTASFVSRKLAKHKDLKMSWK